MRSFLVRSLVAVVAIPALVYLFYLGGIPLRVFVVVLTVLAMHEARGLFAHAGAAFPFLPAVLIALLVPWLSHLSIPGISWPSWLALSILVPGFAVVTATDLRQTAASIAAQIVAVIWIGTGFGAFMAIRELLAADGFKWLIVLFANLWIGDTAAYLFGVWLGKAKLSPVVSPNKTIAGAVAQIITSAVVGVVFVAIRYIDVDASLVIAASVLIGIVGQVGDLFESLPKRLAGQKDSSALIPGHGGVLDRFDSALFAAPALYALVSTWPK
jgi:phosphatidate cytidylyltransferase